MISVESPVPLYYQVAGILRRRIADGIYAGGGTIPTEEELGTEFEVSRATIRQAVGELVQAGLLVRRRGTGTYVRPNAREHLGQIFRGSLADLINDSRRARVKTLRIDRSTEVPAGVASQLDLREPIGTIVRRERAVDGRTFAYTINYLPEKYGELLSEDQLRSDSLLWLLHRQGVALTGAEQSIKAQIADPQMSRHLEIPLHESVLFVERLVFGTDQEPVELVQSWYRGDLYEYTVRFDFKPTDMEDFHSQLA